MTRVVISQPMYFPWVGFLAQMALADVLIWLDDAQFSKGSFTNRVQVKTAAGRKWMSIPLLGKGSKTPIMDLEPVDRHWRDSHRSLLKNALGQAPFAADALAVLDEVLDKTQGDRLCETIIASAENSALATGIAPVHSLRSSEMDVPGTGWRRVLDLVSKVGGTHYVTGHGARNYLDHQAFADAGITVDYMRYDPLPWVQQSGPFTPHVTGLDLIAACPPDARTAHLNPATTPWQDFLDQKAT